MKTFGGRINDDVFKKALLRKKSGDKFVFVADFRNNSYIVDICVIMLSMHIMGMRLIIIEFILLFIAGFF